MNDGIKYIAFHVSDMRTRFPFFETIIIAFTAGFNGKIREAEQNRIRGILLDKLSNLSTVAICS